MTPDEIMLSAQVRQERDIELARTLAWAAYNSAALIGVAVNSPKKFPQLSEAFPSLFGHEIQQQQDWRLMKQRLEDFKERQAGKL